MTSGLVGDGEAGRLGEYTCCGVEICKPGSERLKVIEAAPDVPATARQNRDFLGRVVRFLVGEAGIGGIGRKPI